MDATPQAPAARPAALHARLAAAGRAWIAARTAEADAYDSVAALARQSGQAIHLLEASGRTWMFGLGEIGKPPVVIDLRQPEWEFTLRIGGFEPNQETEEGCEEFASCLYAAGLRDGAFSIRQGVPVVDVTRAADTRLEAIESAVGDACGALREYFGRADSDCEFEVDLLAEDDSSEPEVTGRVRISDGGETVDVDVEVKEPAAATSGAGDDEDEEVENG